MLFLPEALTRRFGYVSMRRLASTQSKYDGTNQNSLKTPYFRTTEISSRGKKSGHNPWQTDMPKPWMHEEEQRTTAANSLLYWTDGGTARSTELLNWCTDGLRNTSSTSTTSP